MSESLENILNYSLLDNGVPVPFSMRTMKDVHIRNQGMADMAHRHDYYTIFWISKGSGKHVVDFNTYEMTAGDIFFVNPGQIHQVIPDNQPDGFIILFTNEFLVRSQISEQFISDLSIFNDCCENPPLQLPQEILSQLLVFAKGMQNEYERASNYRFEALGAYLKLFLITCNQHCTLPSEVTNQNPSAHLLRQFKNMVESNFKHQHKVKHYADALMITSGHVNDIVKQFLGKTAKQYISDRIILEAKRLLLYTDLTAKSIAYDLGFEDPAHFSKFFKTHEAMSIQDFRQEETFLPDNP